MTLVVGTAAWAGADTSVFESSGPATYLTLTRTALPLEDLPTSARVISSDEIQRSDARTLGEALRREVGIQQFPLGGLGSLLNIGLRGSTTDQVLILLDGRPLNGASLGAPDLAEYSIEEIDRIEILRGPASAIYGPDAMAGVVNVITKRVRNPGRPAADFHFEGGSFGTIQKRVSFGLKPGWTEMFISASQKRSSGFRENADTAGHNIFGNFGIFVPGGGKFLFDIGDFHSDLSLPGALGTTVPDLAPADFDGKRERVAATPKAKQFTDSQYIRTSYLQKLPAGRWAALRLFGSHREVDRVDPDNAINRHRDEQSKGGELQLDLPLGVGVGGSYLGDRVDDTDRIVSTHTYLRSVENWGAFFQQVLRSEHCTFIPAVRHDRHSQWGASTSPRGTLAVRLTDRWKFSSTGGRSFRVPTLDELFSNRSILGNPDLEPETAWGFDAGIEGHLQGEDKAGLIRMTYFKSFIHDLIQGDASGTFANVGKARREGVELEIAGRTERWESTVNYSNLRHRGIPTGFTNFVPLPMSPSHIVNGELTYTTPFRVRVTGVARHLSRRFAGPDETGEILPPLTLFDARLTFKLLQAEFFLRIDNLLNRRYVEQPGTPQPGRTVAGGVTLRLWD